MSEHHASITWSRGERPFAYEEYGRDHAMTFGTGTSITASAATEYRGNAALPNPEELYVAALSSCHMLTFLAICARKKIVVERYQDAAIGWLERPAGQPMHVTRVLLRPKVTFGSVAPDAAALADLHAQAHRGCFIAQSVKTDVTVEAV